MKISKLLVAVTLCFVCFIALAAYNEVSKKSSFDKTKFAPAIDPDTIMNDISEGVVLKKASGKYKYKGEESSDAKQSWKASGSVPTTHASFDTVNTISLGGSADGQSVNDSFWVDTTGIKGRNNSRLKQKFKYYKTGSKSCSGSKIPSYGLFSGEIEDGYMKFRFSINKANEGGLLQGMDDYDQVQSTMQEEKKRDFEEPVSGSVGLNSATHYYNGTAKCKARKSAAKGTLSNN